MVRNDGSDPRTKHCVVIAANPTIWPDSQYDLANAGPKLEVGYPTMHSQMHAKARYFR